MDKILKSKYKITEKICESEVGSTYKGRLLSDPKEILVKIYNRNLLDSALLNNLHKRISLLCKLDHPNIAVFLDGDYGWHGFFFVREYCEGINLFNYAKEQKTLSFEQIINIMIQIGEAVSSAHSKDIVHGTLNPANVILVDDKRIKVTDFGIDDGIRTTFRQRAALIYKDSRFISPEEVEGVFCQRSSDIYKMGILLYFLLTGELPFEESYGLGAALRRLNEPALNPSLKRQNIPKFLEEIAVKALEKDPMIRFSSAAELVESLKSRAVRMPKELDIDTTKIDAEKNMAKPLSSPKPRMRAREENIFGGRIALAVTLAIIAGVMYAFIQVFIGR